MTRLRRALLLVGFGALCASARADVPRSISNKPKENLDYVSKDSSTNPQGEPVKAFEGDPPTRYGDAPTIVLMGTKTSIDTARVGQLIALPEPHALGTNGARGGAASAYSSSGRSAFVANDFSNQVSAFSVEPATGNLTLAPGSPYAVGDNPQGLTVDPTGRFLYVNNVFGDTISAFSIDLQTSALTPIGTFAAGDAPQAIASSRRFLFATNLGLDTGGHYSVSVFAIDPSSGALTPVPGSPFPYAGGAPFSMALTPEGRFLYVSGGPGFAVDRGTGALTPLAGGDVGAGVQKLAVHPFSPFLYAVLDSAIQTYRFDYDTGALTAVGAPVAVDPEPTIGIAPSGEALYAASSATLKMHSYTIDNVTGIPAEVGTPISVPDVVDSISVHQAARPEIAGLGVPYRETLRIRGGTPPYSLPPGEGALPDGIHYDSATGVVSGTPTATGISSFSVQIRDGVGNLTSQAYTIQVIAAPVVPAAPGDLTASATSPTEASLSWHDNAAGTGAFRIEESLDGGDFEEVDEVPPFMTSRVVHGLSPATKYAFRIRSSNAGGTSDYTASASATTAPAAAVPCVASDFAVCLGGRFLLEAAFETPSGDVGQAHVLSLTPDTAYLWFFSSTNVEAVVKVLSTCGINQHYWVFAGGLTNIHVALKITDTATGAVREYENPINDAFVPIQQTSAFGTCNASPAAGLEERAAPTPVPPPPSEEAAGWNLPAASPTCTPGDTAMCLDGARFKVEASYTTSDGRAGAAHMVQITPDTGYMWFFNDTNVEAVVKVLPACGVNQHHWVFAGGLTNVDVQWKVTDTVTGEVKPYHNPQGTPFQPVQDTSAFACP
jgi:6-phosphogluconolactonase